MKSQQFIILIFSFDKHKLGGSVLAQTLNKIGDEVPTVKDAEFQSGILTAFRKMIDKIWFLPTRYFGRWYDYRIARNVFCKTKGGLNVNLDYIAENSLVTMLLPKIGVLDSGKRPQSSWKNSERQWCWFCSYSYSNCRTPFEINRKKEAYSFSINDLRDLWFKPSYLLDRKQSGEVCAQSRYNNYKNQTAEFAFNAAFKGKLSQFGISPDRKPSGVKRLSFVKKEQMVNAKWRTHFTWQASMWKTFIWPTLQPDAETLEDVKHDGILRWFLNSGCCWVLPKVGPEVSFQRKSKTGAWIISTNATILWVWEFVTVVS